MSAHAFVFTLQKFLFFGMICVGSLVNLRLEVVFSYGLTSMSTQRPTLVCPGKLKFLWLIVTGALCWRSSKTGWSSEQDSCPGVSRKHRAVCQLLSRDTEPLYFTGIAQPRVWYLVASTCSFTYLPSWFVMISKCLFSHITQRTYLNQSLN